MHDPRHQGSMGFRKRGGRASRQKGNRTERAPVRYLQERGFSAVRVHLSGAAHGRFGGDVSMLRPSASDQVDQRHNEHSAPIAKRSRRISMLILRAIRSITLRKRTRLIPAKTRPDIGTRLPQAVQTKRGSRSDSLMCSGPGIGALRDVVAALVIRATDQDATNTGFAHLVEGDVLGGLPSP